MGKMDELPPPGVSNIGGDLKSRSPVAAVPPPRGSKGVATGASKSAGKQARMQKPGEDVLANPSAGRRVSSTVPTGVNGRENDIIEMPMPKTKLPARSMTSFESVDGNVYTFRTHDSRGKPLAYRNEMSLFIALVEVEKGGKASTVFDAFKLRISDALDVQYYPIPEDVMNILTASAPVEAEPEEVEEDRGYKFGE